MKKFAVSEAIKGMKGVLVCGNQDMIIEEVIIDSRKAAPKAMLIPIVGEKQDGHIYAESAVQSGCRMLAVHREDLARLLFEKYAGLTIVLVEDTTRALQDLAEYYLSWFDVHKIAVTGSVGKTTVKEMLYTVFSKKYNTVKTIGNLNNHIGLPLTIFTVEEETEAVVFEMGMSEFGEIRRLVDIVKPKLAVITGIGASHIEYLKSRENILKAKMEITDHFQRDNILVVNSDNDLLAPEAIEACICMKRAEDDAYAGEFRLCRVGAEGEPDFSLSQLRNLGEEGISFVVSSDADADENRELDTDAARDGSRVRQEFHIPLLGLHNAQNAALAAAAGTFFGISLKDAAVGLAEVENAARRLNIEERNGIKLIDDTYNASLESMKAAIDVLASLKGKRRIAMLADILELGEEAEEYHCRVGRHFAGKNIDLLIAVGPYAKFIAAEAEKAAPGMNIIYHETKDPLLSKVELLLQSGDVVLVKGSNSMQMTEVVNKIRSLE